MSFLSASYLLFLPVTALLRYLLPGKLKQCALLASSWFFYLCWGPVNALFLLFTTLSTYLCARLIARRRLLLWPLVTLLLNFGVLLVFKYADFFLSLGGSLFVYLGLAAEPPAALELLLPVGVSFYTFQAAGYVIDVWRGTLPAERNLLDYALFLDFFPQLASGPIGRADALLPQLRALPRFSDADLKAGCLRILWGAAKKLLLADWLGVIVHTAFADVRNFHGGQLAFAVLCLSFWIYVDFSAYTDIALGSARILGVRLAENFRAPYLAHSIKEFWRRWHISLSGWFRDYLYIPLGGSRVGKVRLCLNILIVFAVSGLWHGAALTFVVWGAIHGALQAAGLLLRPLRERLYRVVPRESLFIRAVSLLGTFLLVSAAWVFFQAGSLGDAVYVLGAVAHWALHPVIPAVAGLGLGRAALLRTGVFLLIFCVLDVLREKRDVSAWLCARDVLRYAVYFAALVCILLLGYYGNSVDPQDFVYFKF